MTPHALLTQAKQHLATGSGQPDKKLAICFALDAVTERVPKRQRKAARVTANAIKDEIMAYLSPYATFYGHTRTGGRHPPDCEQVQAIRHTYIDRLIEEART